MLPAVEPELALELGSLVLLLLLSVWGMLEVLGGGRELLDKVERGDWEKE